MTTEARQVDSQPANEPRVASVDPGWLTPNEQATWRALTALVTRLPSALDADLQATSGLSLFEYQVLAHLSEAPGWTMRMSELGPRVNSSPSRLSHGVARLERRGWVCRAPLLGDGRQITASLTPRGYDKVRESAVPHVRFVRSAIIDGLTAQQLGQLLDIAESILARVATVAATTRTCPPTDPPSACAPSEPCPVSPDCGPIVSDC